MGDGIYITGIGVVSAIGNSAEECYKALSAEKTGIGEIVYLDTLHRGEFMLGEVKRTNAELLSMLSIPDTEGKKYTRTALLGAIAAKEALAHAGINCTDGLRTALVSSTTVGGMDVTEQSYGIADVGTAFIYTHPCGDSTDKIGDYLGIYDYRTTLSTACSSGANALMHGAKLIKHGIVDRAVVGGVDALSKFTLNGFNSLMIFDKEWCKPFDNRRRGLNLGEGAGFVVLESGKTATSKRILCKLTGYANANDAYHQTASSPDGEGAVLAMNKALQVAGLAPEDIDYINVHGTGTDNNDMSEGTALKRIFGDSLPAFSSTKSYTGHTLAAAAGIEAVFSVLSVVNGVLFPNLNFEEPIEALGIVPETTFRSGVDIKHVLSNSFGFGGNNSAVIFSK